MKTVFFIAGEASGDQLGALLTRSLHDLLPNYDLTGIGGPLMRKTSFSCVLPMEQLQVMGFTDVVKALPRLARIFFKIKHQILDSNPSAIVFIDYPGFNLRMARALRKSGYTGKMVQYVSPTVWAHGRERVQHLAETVDLLLTIYPFEKEYYSETDLTVEYVGHPLVDHISNYTYNKDWQQKIGLTNTEGLLGIFPGSRAGELRQNLYNQLLTAQKLQEMHPGIPIAISCAHQDLLPLIKAKLTRWKKHFHTPPVIVPPEFRYELMRSCQAAIAVSGTVTLELALHTIPTLVLYHVTPLNRLFARYILGLTMTRYCIVNIISGRDLFPEFILQPFRLPIAYTHLESLFSEGPIRRQCLSGCHHVLSILDGHNGHLRAAQSIVELLKE